MTIALVLLLVALAIPVLSTLKTLQDMNFEIAQMQILASYGLYLGLMALRSSIEDESLAAKLTAILALVGIVMLPIIKFSVEFGNTLYQPASVIRAGGPTIDNALLVPLLVMAVGFTLMFVAMHLKAMRNEILRRRVKALQLAEVERAQATQLAAAE